ncbi:hypothetical protein ANN_17329 [Periplaneta americana]|uniref:Histone-lysine N-methyltransferase SETMAR n=1 Tax=Periplaneta americana TaxID=6978 RepID=A0ABQ8STN2_PERAM|nr:hypothetical protein ANN_17329 [Periplaneta americana]
MAGLCEGGNEPPGSLKASKERSVFSGGKGMLFKSSDVKERAHERRSIPSRAGVEFRKHRNEQDTGADKCKINRLCRTKHYGLTSSLVRQCIMENRRFTITELSSHFPQISRSLLHEIVIKHLLFKKMCARWVPKNLTSEHKMQRLGAALIFLQRYHDDGDEFLDSIVTGDETWISHFTPETKQQSMHWRHSGSPVRTKFKQTLSVRKVVYTVFWDRKGILLIDFLPRGETVNADRYCETLRKLRSAIQNKRRGMLTAGVVLLHDNARPHMARRTAAVLTEFGWELFHHLPYSPDLSPSDFHVFLHLKKFLSSGERFGNDEELKSLSHAGSIQRR